MKEPVKRYYSVKPFEVRLSEKINKRGLYSDICGSRCWEWLGYKDQAGYGMITTHKDAVTGHPRATTVHQVMWIALFGAVPDRMVIRHLCNNRACCNPDHLTVGTRKENTRDMVRSGRARGRLSSGYNHVFHTKSTMPKKTKAERFWEKVKVLGEHDCWLWLAAKEEDGYGVFDNARAHRVAYELEYGVIPEGLIVLHSCDTPACVNPKHLSVGTWADNMIDARNKGRKAKKLSSEDVLAIRTLYVTGKYTQMALADLYGVSNTSIYSVVHGKAWKHV